MNAQTAADLAQAIADLNAAAAALGLPPGWLATPPATLADAVAAHRGLTPTVPIHASRPVSPFARKPRP